jgi:hypothetical protein
MRRGERGDEADVEAEIQKMREKGELVHVLDMSVG